MSQAQSDKRRSAKVEVLHISEFPSPIYEIRGICYKVMSTLKADFKFDQCVKIPNTDKRLQANLHTYARRMDIPITTMKRGEFLFVARADCWKNEIKDRT